MRIKLAAPVVMVALALPLCIAQVAQAQISEPDETPARTPASAQAPAACAKPTPTPKPTMKFNGIGEAHHAPDVAELGLQIETHAPTSEEALSSNTASVNKVVAALTAKLAGKGKVRAGGYSLTPVYGHLGEGEQPKLRGYNAQNSITIETRATDLLGGLMYSGIAAGAPQAVPKSAWWQFTSAPVSPVTLWSVSYVNFRLKDEAKARAEALSLAAHDARTQAEAVGAALGVKLTRVVGVSAGVGVTGPTLPVSAQTWGGEQPLVSYQAVVQRALP
jgi:uncharacterized protein YggE